MDGSLPFVGSWSLEDCAMPGGSSRPGESPNFTRISPTSPLLPSPPLSSPPLPPPPLSTLSSCSPHAPLMLFFSVVNIRLIRGPACIPGFQTTLKSLKYILEPWNKSWAIQILLSLVSLSLVSLAVSLSLVSLVFLSLSLALPLFYFFLSLSISLSFLASLSYLLSWLFPFSLFFYFCSLLVLCLTKKKLCKPKKSLVTN